MPGLDPVARHDSGARDLCSRHRPRGPDRKSQNLAESGQILITGPNPVGLPEIDARLADADLFGHFGNRQTTSNAGIAKVFAEAGFTRQRSGPCSNDKNGWQWERSFNAAQGQGLTGYTIWREREDYRHGGPRHLLKRKPADMDCHHHGNAKRQRQAAALYINPCRRPAPLQCRAEAPGPSANALAAADLAWPLTADLACL